MTGKRQRGCLLLTGAILLLSLCAGCLGAIWGSQTWLPQTASPVGFAARTCAAWGTTATGHFQVGGWWVWPSSPTGRFGAPKRPYISRHSACGFLPWAPFLPRRGSFGFSL